MLKFKLAYVALKNLLNKIFYFLKIHGTASRLQPNYLRDPWSLGFGLRPSGCAASRRLKPLLQTSTSRLRRCLCVLVVSSDSRHSPSGHQDIKRQKNLAKKARIYRLEG